MSGELDVRAGVWRVGRGGRCMESGTWGQVSGEWGLGQVSGEWGLGQVSGEWDVRAGV